MSEEAREKVKSIKYLPIFTWSDVLAPFVIRGTQPVHVYEKHHRLMLKDVMRDNKMFGVSYSPKTGERPEAGSLGCVAEITDVKEFPGGDSNIKFQGIIRYKIEKYVDAEMNAPYPLAEVSFFEDEPEDEEMLWELSIEAGKIFQQFVKSVFKPHGVKPNAPLLKANPIPYSFTFPDLYSFPPEIKLELLAVRRASERLRQCCEYLRELLEASRDINKRYDFIRPFNTNRNKSNLG
jgi:Lon protease-like protein